MIGEFAGEHRFLSNFYKSPLEYEGDTYPTVEHAFQAAKTSDPDERAGTRAHANPVIAKRKGRRVGLRADWETAKRDIMRALLQSKFQDEALRVLLLQTGNEELVEGNRWHDNYWGRCTCAKCEGKGQNALGELLMQLRSELQKEAAGTSAV